MKRISILTAIFCANLFSLQANSLPLEQQRLLIDKYFTNQLMIHGPETEQQLKQSLSEEALPYLIDSIHEFENARKVSISLKLLSLIAQKEISDENRDVLSSAGIDCIRHIEEESELGPASFSLMSNAFNLLVSASTEESVNFIVERAEYVGWEDAADFTFMNGSGYDLRKYRRVMRDMALSAIASFEPKKALELLARLVIPPNDPDRGMIARNVGLKKAYLNKKYYETLSDASGNEPLAKVHADIYSIVAALEAYRIDNNTYPDSLESLVEPIAYLPEVPRDQYRNSQIYRYESNGEGFMLSSAGEDGVHTLGSMDASDDITLKVNY